MGRSRIPANNPNQHIILGWDKPLETFFAQVYDSTVDEDENPILWLGATPGDEINSVEQLQDRLSQSGYLSYIPPSTQLELARQQKESEPPSPLQRKIKDIFRNLEG